MHAAVDGVVVAVVVDAAEVELASEDPPSSSPHAAVRTTRTTATKIAQRVRA
jgi:hypothetical protein